MKPEIHAIVAAINELTRQMAVDAERIEKLEAALRDIAALGYWDGDSAMSIARKALEKSNEDA